MPILCTCVHLGMANNVDLESFYFLCVKKLFFILLASKIIFLWSTYQNNVVRMDHNNSKKNQKNTNHSCCVMLCDLVARKNNKLRILQTFWKSVHKKELSHTKFHGFQARWASYGFNHDIVLCSNPILCIYVPLEWQTIFILCVLFFGIKSSFLFF
jgi:hypothetical protein